MGVYEEIANMLQARLSNAKVVFMGESIFYPTSMVYTITFETKEPLTGQVIKEIKEVAHEFNHILVDFMAWSIDGKPDMMFWIMPKPEIKPVKVPEV